MWNGKTYYFHVGTTHKDKKRWFQHSCANCKTCQKFKRENSNNAMPASTDADAPTATLSDLTSNASPPQDVSALLSAAYNQLSGKPNGEAIQVLLADALEALQE